MPRFTGKQYPGALKDLREQRKLEAQQRNTAFRAHRDLAAREVGDDLWPSGWTRIDDTAHEPRVISAATRLLNALFGNPADREVQP